jgi:4'-phosphopantetheinyl transferase
MVDIRFSVNDKPFVPGNSLHFNIAHSREMFAVAFSHYGETGIDIEFVNRELDFEKIMENYFSENERKSILASGDNARKKFFLYRTRKEALLKAMGLGITQDLTKIEITDGDNLVTISNAGISIEKEYLVYTTRIGDYYLSLAQSTEAAISITELNNNKVFSEIQPQITQIRAVGTTGT